MRSCSHMCNINLKMLIVCIFTLMNNSVKQRIHSGAVSSRINFISKLSFLKELQKDGVMAHGKDPHDSLL